MNSRNNGLGLLLALIEMGPIGHMGSHYTPAPRPKGQRFEIDGVVVYALNRKSAEKKAAKSATPQQESHA